MRFTVAVVLLLGLWERTADAFAPASTSSFQRTANGPLSAATMEAAVESAPFSVETISNMSFRDLQNECKTRGLDQIGTTATLRNRLKGLLLEEDCDPKTEDCEVPMEPDLSSINFVNEADPDFDYKELVKEVTDKASMGHWKVATRRLKKLGRRFPDKKVDESVYLETLQACMANRLHGARASEPARKIIEQLLDNGYSIPSEVGNFCVQNCIGDGPNGTHDNCGGIDTALAMVAALEAAETPLTVDSYGKILSALVKDGETEDAMGLLRSIVVDRFLTPSLELFSQVAYAITKSDPEKVFTVLAYAKAAGYELDTVASTQDGRTLLASGVIAAEKLDNVALGLRLLTAASKASGCAPDRGDDLVASSSSAAQRASTLIHKRAINQASQDGNWRLAVKLLEVMMERSLKPSPWVWRNVIAGVAKAEKSRKATALLLDWVKLAEKGEMEKPSLQVFNTVINVCEICDEHELTLVVLDTMRKTHETEGNLITFNIALKRLAKEGSPFGCEGIIIGMLRDGFEPSVVSYTTAIASCVSADPKDPKTAYEWLKRMRSRNVTPNVLTYNTALAACLDGKVESTMLGSKIASEFLEDIDRQILASALEEEDSSKEEENPSDPALTDVMPDPYSKGLARQLMKQLRDNWRADDINMQVAKATVRVPLLKLVDFQKSEAAKALKEQQEKKKKKLSKEEDQVDSTSVSEAELEFATSVNLHRTAEV